jgi:hypothetical protein
VTDLLPTTGPWLAVWIVVVAVLGAGRLTRLVTADSWPPSAWWRDTWSRWTHDGPWSLLFSCHWCFGPWAALAALGTAFIGAEAGRPHLVWWLFWGWLAVSYLVSIVVHHDEGVERS